MQTTKQAVDLDNAELHHRNAQARRHPSAAASQLRVGALPNRSADRQPARQRTASYEPLPPPLLLFARCLYAAHTCTGRFKKEACKAGHCASWLQARC